MKVLGKIIAYFFLIVFTLALSLILIAELAENKIAKIALSQLNEDVDATISVDNIDLSFIKNFPLAVVEFQDVMISSEIDTLAHIKRLFVSVEMMPLIDSQFNITEIAVEGGMANYTIDEDGATNFDAFISEPSEQSTDTTQLLLSLNHLEINKLFLNYNNKANNTAACLYIDEGLTSVYIDKDNTKASFKGQLRANNCNYQNSKLDLMTETQLNIDVVYFNELININKLNLQSDGININAKGELQQDSSIRTNLEITSAQADLKTLSKYIPDSLINEFDIKEIDGTVSLKAQISGLYNDSTMPHIKAKFELNNAATAISDYPKIEDITIKGSYTNGKLNNNTTTHVVIDTLAFNSINNSAFLSGSILNLDTITYQLSGKLKASLADFEKYLPDSTIETMDGLAQLQFSTNGVLPQHFNDAFTDYALARTNAQLTLSDINIGVDTTLNIEQLSGQLVYNKKNFSLNKLALHIPDYPLTLTHCNIKGNYAGSISNINDIKVRLSDFDIATKQSQIQGSASFSNPDYPEYDFDGSVNINLEEWMPFAPDSLIKQMSGNIRTHLASSGKINLDSISDQMMETIFCHSEINSSFKDVNVEMQDSLISLNNLSGLVQLKNDSLSISKLKGAFSDINFSTDTSSILNIYNAYWLNKPDTIKATGNYHFGDINYALFDAMINSDTTNTTEEPSVSEPSNFLFKAKGKIFANSFKYGKAELNNISALYNVSDSLYLIDQFKFDAFKGSLITSVKVKMGANNEMKINFRNKTHNLDIGQLLDDFDNFNDYTDEELINSEQLSGTFSTENLNGYFLFRDSLITDSILMSADLKLENGLLENYPITKEMGKDYNIDGLETLKFKTIDTKMFVYTGSVYAPLTNIKTNTFDVSLFGMQNFNLDCQYHLRFYIKEILRKGKTNRIEKKQSKESKQTDDGGTKGLSSLFAIYKIEDGKTVKSALESKDSKARKDMKINIFQNEALLKFVFHSSIVNYKTGVDEE